MLSDQTFVELFAFTICAAVILIFVGLFTGCVTLEPPHNKNEASVHACVKAGKMLRCDGRE